VFADELSEQANEVFRAALQAVSAVTLIDKSVQMSNSGQLVFGNSQTPLLRTGTPPPSGSTNSSAVAARATTHHVEFLPANFDRIVMVGAGKASGELTRQFCRRLSELNPVGLPISGWVNVADNDPVTNPAADTQAASAKATISDSVRIFPARPVNENLPTPRVLEGTQQVLSLVRQLGPRDLCVSIISGGGSALLCAPMDGISLEDKRWVGRELARRGATIEQINRVRQQLSLVKGGRLIAQRRQGAWVSLILSDVLGDPWPLIASGPTIPQADNPSLALDTLLELGLDSSSTPAAIWRVLQTAASRSVQPQGDHQTSNMFASRDQLPAYHCLLGNLQTAVLGGAVVAEPWFTTTTEVQRQAQETVQETFEHLVTWLLASRSSRQRRALVRGGEPTLQLQGPAGCGGRNSHLVLSVIDRLLRLPDSDFFQLPRFCLLVAGTDGEDGSAPGAGGWVNDRMIGVLREQRIDVTPYLVSYDAFSFFRRWQTTCETGATLTNVGDLQIALVAAEPAFSAVK
jgi:hydroxypyruvate reductase